MKIIRLSMFIHFLILAGLTDGTFAQEYTQFNLPQDAKLRIGKGTIVDMAYSPDGNRLAVATSIGIWIYDSWTGQEVDMLQGHTHKITGIAYAPDGRTLASGSVGQDDTIILWDTVSGTHKATLTEPPFGVYCIAFSPDGKTIATGGYEEVQLWDAVSGERKASFMAHASMVINNIAFSPDGKTLAIGGFVALSIRLWDVATSTHKATLMGHKSLVTSIAFSSDGKTIATGSSDGIRLWDAVSGAHKTTLVGNRASRSVTFSPNGRTLASGTYKEVELWDVPSGQHRQTLTGHTALVNSIAFSPDGRTIATVDSEIRLWDAASGAHKASFAHHMGTIGSVAFSPDGKSIASAGTDKTIYLWDGISGAHKTILTGHTDSVTSVAFSPDGQTLVSSSSDKTIRLWDVVSGVQKAEFTGHTWVVTSVAFSPDGQTLVSSSWDRTIRLWDVVRGTHKATLTGHTGIVNSVAFSPDGKSIVSGSRDKTIRLWDARSGQHRQTLTGPIEGVHSVAFSPDGKTIATGTEFGTAIEYQNELAEIWLWDATTGKYKADKKGFHLSVSFAFSPDGRTLATQTKQGHQVMLWDASTGVVKTTFPRHSSVFRSFAFSPDGKTIATGTGDGFILLWELTPTTLQPSEQTSVILSLLPASPPRVRIVYFFPNDHTPQSNIVAELRRLIKETQHFYAEQMENHGFGRKTFQFETDSNGNAVVHHVKGGRSAEDYINGGSRKIMRELQDILNLIDHIYLVVLDTSLQGSLSGWCGLATFSGWNTSPGNFQMSTHGRFAVVYASGACAGVSTTAHELGHTFGLAHDFRNKSYIMNHIIPETPRLSYAAAEWLNVHPLFNPGQPHSGNHTTIEVLSPRASRLQFQVADVDGLQQAQLILNNVENKICGGTESLHHFKALNGSASITFEFAATRVSTRAALRAIDVHGNITWRNIWIEPDNNAQGDIDTPDSIVQGDVNSDGVVDLIDLLLVAKAHRQNQPANPRTDVNGDGIVNIEDILLVADAIELDAGAPSLHPMVLDIFTASTVRGLLHEVQQMDLTDPSLQRGILVLEQLLAVLIPKETTLLPNYPNPFNPETWIPYQLAKPAPIAVSIYSTDGALVRMLPLGHLPAGIYESRNRAVYWDGKNQLGEPVASGLYFYTLTAGDFTATRKMLILK